MSVLINPAETGVTQLKPVGQIRSVNCFVNQVLLEHSPIHSFTYYYGGFCAKRAKSSRSNRRSMTPKASNIHYQALYRKCLLTHVLDAEDSAVGEIDMVP